MAPNPFEDLFGGEMVGQNVEVGMVPSMRESTELLGVFGGCPIESFPLTADGVGGVEEDEDVRAGE
jgi:hypothetical protein